MAVAIVTLPWWPLSPWLSPGAAWFIFFNAVVAAIAVMSSCAPHQVQDGPSTSRRGLRRSASSAVLDQLRSLALFSVHPTAAGGVAVTPLDDVVAGSSDPDCCYRSCSREAEAVPGPRLVTVTQVSTVVPETAEPSQPKPPVAGENVSAAASAVTLTAPAAMAAAAEWASASAPGVKDEEADAEEEQDKSISMDEAYAMVLRRRLPRQSPPAPPPAAIANVATTTAPAASWPQKTSDLAAEGPPKRRRGREAGEEEPEGKAELNARADLFIRQFREELKLQRLNSLLRHAHALGARDVSPTAVR